MDGEQFDWKAFQEKRGYTDEELKMFMADPHRTKAAKRMGLPERQKKYLIFEVISSEGCPVQLKVGSRLFFKGTTMLDLEKSDPWCINAMGSLKMLGAIAHNRWVSGLDLNDMHLNHFQCADCGVKNGGWGRIAMKAYVKDESEL